MLVHTVVRRDLIEQIGLPRLTDVLDYHSSVPDAAQTAERNGVRTLTLTHLVPPPAAGTEQEWIDQATPHFKGKVVVAADLLTFNVTASPEQLDGPRGSDLGEPSEAGRGPRGASRWGQLET